MHIAQHITTLKATFRGLLLAGAIAMASLSTWFLVQDTPAAVPIAWTVKCTTTFTEDGKKVHKQECTSGGTEWPCDCGWGGPVF